MMDYEKAVIGMVLADQNLYDIALSVGVDSETFIFDVAQRIWTSFAEIKASNGSIDLIAITAKLPKDIDYIMACVGAAPVVQNFEYFCRCILTKAWSRKAAMDLSVLARELMTFDCTQDVEIVKAKLSRLYDSLIIHGSGISCSIPIKRTISNYTEVLEERIVRHREGHLRGIATPLEVLNNGLGGWIGGRLYILAARTSIGKTTLAVNFSNTALNLGKHVLFCSNEMSDLEIAEKKLSLRTGVIGSRLFVGNLTGSDMDAIVLDLAKLAHKNLLINMKVGRYLERFESECRKLKRQGKLDLVIIDYIQQMRSEAKQFQQRNLEIGYISDKIKELARELDVPIIALAQINREVERHSRPQMPNLSHLKDSGSLEQDADAVIIIHKETDEHNVEHTHLNIAKNRFGKTGDVEISSNLAINKFGDLYGLN